MLALGFALVAPAPFASAQEQATDAEPSAAAPAPVAAEPAPKEQAAAEPAAEPATSADVQPATAATAPATATGEQTTPDVRPASAKRKRKAAEAQKATEETIRKIKIPHAPPDMKVASPEEQKKLAEDVAKGMIHSADDLPDQPAAAPMTDKQAVEANARELFFSIMSGDARAIALHSIVPFALEDKRISNQDDLFQEWLKHLRSKRTDLLVLYGVEVLTPDEMEKAYGKPPARLGNFPWRNGKSFIAIGNLSGHAAIAVFRETRPGDFEVAAYTD